MASAPELALSPYGSAKAETLGVCAYCGEEIASFDGEECEYYEADGVKLHTGFCFDRYKNLYWRKTANEYVPE